MKKVIVIGAGVGGLTTAAILARAGIEVTVLEAHVYAGGCAGTFYHQGYRFDAGATLAGGFYPGGPMDLVGQAAGIEAWPAKRSNPAMTAHLSDGTEVVRWTDERRWETRRKVFGEQADKFWHWQEKTADALWQLALSQPSWPPQTVGDLINLIRKSGTWAAANPRVHLSPELVADLFRPVSVHLKNMTPQLRQFIDGQLLIAAQTTSAHANALYGASALDLPRRGVVHLKGGMGGIANVLTEAVRANGGKVLFRKDVKTIIYRNHQIIGVETNKNEFFDADTVVANLPPWNIVKMLPESVQPARLRNLPEMPEDGWGAFMLYVGAESSVVPNELPLHHQVIVREPLAEGNTVFLSMSPEWDNERAPMGHRAMTLSTHTDLKQWWSLFENDRDGYEARKRKYTEKMLAAAEKVLPGLRDAAELVKPGTPVTFQRFTRRRWGWVGGFPQTNLFKTWGPRLAENLWMVGDSIFPGQSTAAVALGGMRVADQMLSGVGLRDYLRMNAGVMPADSSVNLSYK